MVNPSFGRLEPKTWTHVEKYPFRKLGLPAPENVNIILPRPPLRTIYNQKDTNGCTGYSATWLTSINNYPPTRLYDAYWLYCQGTVIDGDPSTSPEIDAGGYLWAVMEVLRTKGHVLFRRNGTKWPPRPIEGIRSYYWCLTVDDIRTAIWMKRPFVLGINWYESFMNPVRKDGRWWIGTETKWGNIIGGHAICGHGIMDNLDCALLVNTWGTEYPPVYIPYDAISRLLSEQGEAVAAIDL